MQQFKVGDFIRFKNQNDVYIIDSIVDGAIYNESNWIGDVEYAEPWQPKEGEWCWFDTGIYNECVRLVQFNSLIDNKYCEPFIGELPSFLQEQP